MLNTAAIAVNQANVTVNCIFKYEPNTLLNDLYIIEG